jgi:hypothetical protein
MDIGTYKDNGTSGGSPIYWHTNQPYSQFWQSSLSAYQLGKVWIKVSLKLFLVERLHLD